jgi:hypothetical protein
MEEMEMGKRQQSGPMVSIEDVNWDATPLFPDERMIKIWAAKCARPLDVYILSRKMEKTITHWVDGQSKPCTKPMTRCYWCQSKYGLRWKGYVGIFDPRDGRVALAEITLNAFNSCPALRTCKDLRGGRLKLTRPGTMVNAAVKAEFFPWHKSFGFALDDIPAEFNVREALMRVWLG